MSRRGQIRLMHVLGGVFAVLSAVSLVLGLRSAAGGADWWRAALYLAGAVVWALLATAALRSRTGPSDVDV